MRSTCRRCEGPGGRRCQQETAGIVGPAVVPPSTVHAGSNSVGVYLARANRLVRIGGS